LDPLLEKHSRYIKDLRRLGLMMGLECADAAGGPVLTKAAYDNDLLLVYANNDPAVCQLLPPLTITEKEIDWVAERLDRALTSAKRLKGLYTIKKIMTG
jgi:acetylornithine aminotransferase